MELTVGVRADERLMTELYEQHADVPLGFVLRYVHDHQRAQDVVQETLLRAWRHLDRLDVRCGDPRSYLMTVARNVLTDEWRAAGRRPRLVHDAEAMATVGCADGIDATVDGLMVTQAIGRLTPEHQAVVQALYYDGWSVAQAAHVLGVPEGTVKSRSYYAVRALRAAFEEMGALP